MRSLCAIVGLVVALETSAHAQVVLKNGAGINMLGSTGSGIVFPDGTTIGSVQDIARPSDHGGIDNTVGGDGAFIGGGTQNEAQGAMSSVVGGLNNVATSDYGAVGGGNRNRVLAPYGTISGGGTLDELATAGNIVYDDFGTIGGGGENTAGLDDDLTDTQSFATVGGGRDNAATAVGATVGGGDGNVASGVYASVPGGQFNSATGAFSFAAGRSAKANHSGSFVWSDDTGTSLTSLGVRTFSARASGGFFFYTSGDLSIGAELPPNESAWETLSDRNAKENLSGVDSVAVLEKLLAIPVLEFNYKGADPENRHLGVMAQDFHAAFDVGNDPLRISTQDADGVSFAAIQGLNRKLARELDLRDREIEALRRELAEIRRILAE